jgi:hypothetical protein
MTARMKANPPGAPAQEAPQIPEALDRFVHHQNIAHYAHRLRSAPDARCRAMIRSLLAAEQRRARANGWVPSPGW